MSERTGAIQRWLVPSRPAQPLVVTDTGQRRALIIEVVLVLAVTLGLSGLRSLLALLDALVAPG
ncbi:MAG: CPBP family intramembrane glutamate endopeptidase, partial [Pseudonocardiaceae bacterium]